jgi:hypothetical protein
MCPRDVPEPPSTAVGGRQGHTRNLKKTRGLELQTNLPERELIAAHPEIDVFAAHDPTALPANARIDRSPAA